MTPARISESALVVARDLAAAHPAAKLPCPACGQSLRADNLSKHLEKVHAGVRAVAMTSWSGADRRILRPLLFVTIAWTLGWGAALAVLPQQHFQLLAGVLAAGLFACMGLMGLAGFDKLGARLVLTGDALQLRYGLGLLRHRVGLPATITAGRVFRARQEAIVQDDAVHEPGHKEGAGAYLRLTHGGASVVVRCPHDCGLGQHWAVERGPNRDSHDISLDRAAFVALEYALAARGLLSLRAG